MGSTSRIFDVPFKADNDIFICSRLQRLDTEITSLILKLECIKRRMTKSSKMLLLQGEIDVMVRVFANGPGDGGSIPG